MNPNPSSQCLRAWSPQRSRLKTAPTNWRHRAPNLPATNRAKPDTRHRWMLINMPIQRTIPLRSTSCHLPSTDPFVVVRSWRSGRTTSRLTDVVPGRRSVLEDIGPAVTDFGDGMTAYSRLGHQPRSAFQDPPIADC